MNDHALLRLWLWLDRSGRRIEDAGHRVMRRQHNRLPLFVVRKHRRSRFCSLGRVVFVTAHFNMFDRFGANQDEASIFRPDEKRARSDAKFTHKTATALQIEPRNELRPNTPIIGFLAASR